MESSVSHAARAVCKIALCAVRCLTHVLGEAGEAPWSCFGAGGTLQIAQRVAGDEAPMETVVFITFLI